MEHSKNETEGLQAASRANSFLYRQKQQECQEYVQRLKELEMEIVALKSTFTLPYAQLSSS